MTAPRHIAWTILLMSLCLTLARADERSDCSDLPYPLEKLVCSSPSLPPSYTVMRGAAAEAKAALSEKGRADLADGQKFWRAQMADECTGPSRLPLDRDVARACLTRQFAARAERILMLYRKTGPFQFSAIEYFKVNYGYPDPSIVGTEIGRQRLAVTYPQIDSPLTTSAQRWNEAVAVWVQQGQTWTFRGQKHARYFDVSIRVIVAHADDRFISLTRAMNVRSAYNAPDQREVRHLNVWIESGASLQPSDLFAPGGGWEDALRRHVRDQVAAFFLNQAVVAQALDPINWSVEPAALTIDLNLHRNGSEVASVVIPWRDLKPYLVSPLPLQLSVN